MVNSFLEDIVEQELKIKTSTSIKINKFLEETKTKFLVYNPALTSIGLFGIWEYLSNTNFIKNNLNFIDSTSAKMIGAYLTYTTLGLTKEYFLEIRSSKIKKGIYNWFFDNPKLVALMGMSTAGLIGYDAEYSLFREFYNVQNFTDLSYIAKIEIIDRTAGMAVAGGIVTEAISRGLKNLKRIKQSIKKLKTNKIERIYNSIFEHPFITSAAATMLTFPFLYNINYSANPLISGNILEDIVNHPSKITSIALTSSLIGVAALATTLVAGSLFHTHSIKELYYRAAKSFNSLTGNRTKAIEYQNKLLELPNSIERTIEDTVSLGNLYYEQGDRDSAFKYYRKSLRLFTKKSGHISYADFFRKTFKFNTIRKSIKKLFQKNSIEEEAINKMFIGLLNKETDALEEIKNLVNNNDTPQIRYMYGKALEIVGYKESGRIQKEIAIRKILESGIELDEKPGSKNKIYEFNNGILAGEIIAKSNTLGKLILESKATEVIREKIYNFEHYDVPIPITILEYNGKALYVMEFVTGDLIADRIRYIESIKDLTEKEKRRRELKTKLTEAADFMGFIHATLKPNGVERESEQVIVERLIEIGIKTETIEKIDNNIYEITNSLDGIVRVQNKDAHSRNWKIDEFGGLIAIDLEADRIVPITYDIANLLDQHGKFTIYEKEELFEKCLASFEDYGGDLKEFGHNRYKLAYLNSVIIRTLEAYTMLRKSDKDIMLDALENSQKAIETIKVYFNDYYKDKEVCYKELNDALEELKVE